MASSVFHYCYPTRWTVTAAIPERILIHNWFSNILPVELSCINSKHVSRSWTKAVIHTFGAGPVRLCRWSVPSAHWSWQKPTLLEIGTVIVSGFHGWLQMGVGWFLHFESFTLITFFFFLFDHPFPTNDPVLLLPPPTSPKLFPANKVVDDLKALRIFMIGIT